MLLIDKVRNEILTSNPEPISFGGDWGDWQKAGRAVWKDVPADAEMEDCRVVSGEIVVDHEKKNAKDKQKKERIELLSRIDEFNADKASPEQQVQFAKDVRQYILG